MFALTVSSSHGTFSNPVTFSTSTLPAGATASFAPSATITPGATPQTVMLSIATTPHNGNVCDPSPTRVPSRLAVALPGQAWFLPWLGFGFGFPAAECSASLRNYFWRCCCWERGAWLLVER